MKDLSGISELITFKLEKDVYGIDIMITQEILDMPELRRIPNAPYFFEGMMDLRGDIIPIINFKKLFHFNYFDLGKEKFIILIQVKNHFFGMVIDQILRKVAIEEGNVRQIGTISKEIERFVKGMVEYNKELISILDIDTIFNVTEANQLLGMKEDEYLLKQTVKYRTHFSSESQKKCYKELQKIGFPFNRTTQHEMLYYILKLSIRNNLNIEKLLYQIIEKTEKTEIYHNFNPDGKKILFDSDEDYYILKNIVLDTIVAQKKVQGNKRLRIWNLGDHSGAESLSIGILLNRFLPNASEWNIRIVCSSPNILELQKARLGKFNATLIRRMNQEDQSVFFNMENGDAILDHTIRDWIVFDVRSPNNPEPPMEEIDLIFARHFLSKLDDSATVSVLDTMNKAMNKGGILLLSEAESIEHFYFDFTVQELSNRKFYMKP